MENDKPLYDSRALTETQWEEIMPVYQTNDEAWERLPTRHGMVYLRRHVSGPVNTESAGWTRCT